MTHHTGSNKPHQPHTRGQLKMPLLGPLQPHIKGLWGWVERVGNLHFNNTLYERPTLKEAC